MINSLENVIERINSYEAPHLEKKLFQNGEFASKEDYDEAFGEFKKYVLLAVMHKGEPLGMASERIDSIWHQMILFTREYQDFCKNYVGFFFHHVPNLDKENSDNSSVVNFRQRYKEVFGELPEIWGFNSSCDTAPDNCRTCSTHKCGSTCNSDS